ncbi:MAG: hypothetical protein AAGJ81_14765 [Verrucomicrobiota bacterium]
MSNKPASPEWFRERGEKRLEDWWESIPVGEFYGLCGAHYAVGPREFEYIPTPNGEFGFIDSAGQDHRPDVFRHDFGSTDVARGLPYLSKIEFPQAYLIHDWDFYRNHACALVGKVYDRTLEQAGATLIESIKTLVVKGHDGVFWKCPPLVANRIYRTVTSAVARRIWEDHTNPKSLSIDLALDATS